MGRFLPLGQISTQADIYPTRPDIKSSRFHQRFQLFIPSSMAGRMAYQPSLHSKINKR